MSDYTKITNFTAKDALTSGDAAKAVKGVDIDAELSAISVAILTKFDSADLATQAEAEAGTDNTKVMTPLRVAQMAAALEAVDAVKTADETVTGSTTLQDDDHLASLSLDASSTYRVRGMFVCEIKATSDLKMLIVLSSAPTATSLMYGAGASSQGTSQLDNSTAAAITTGSDETCVIFVEGVIRTNAAATAKLQWAQNTSQANNTVLKTGSYLSFAKVA